MPEITSFFGCFFTLKIQKKVLRQSQKCPNPLGTTRQTPCGVENHICDHFLGYFAQNNLMLHLCYTCPKIGYFRPFWDKWDKSGTRGYFGQNSPKSDRKYDSPPRRGSGE